MKNIINRKVLILISLLLFLPLLAGCFPSPAPPITENQAPIVISTPIITATVGKAYVYDVEATDPDGDTLTYSLIYKPSGMVINSATGLISWTPPTKGDYDVVVKVSDGSLSVTQSFIIVVSAVPPVTPPPVTPPPVTPPPVTIEEIVTQILETQDLGRQYFEQLESQNDPNALQKTIDYLKTQPNVDNAEVGGDDISIWIEYKSGIEGIILTGPSGSLGGLPISTSYRSNFLTKSTKTASTNQKAIILLPFDLIEGCKDESVEAIFTYLQQSGYSSDNIETYPGEEVTVNLMATLSDYDFIYMTTHGGVGPGVGPIGHDISICTGEKVPYGNIVAALESQLRNLEIQIMSISGVSGYYWALNHKFFEHYTYQGYPGSFVYINACDSFKNDSLADVFLNNGASVYLGWDNITFGFLFAGLHHPQFFQELSKPNNTLQQAYDATLAKYYPAIVYKNTDHDKWWRIELADGEDFGDSDDTTFGSTLNLVVGENSQFILNPQQVVGQISGSVKDAVIQSPLQGVSVEVYDGDSLISSGTTDSSGVYSISVPVGSEYRAEFTKSSYIPAIYYNVSVVANVTTYLETVLQIDTNYSGKGDISGRIFNALTGEGVSGLTINLREGINVTNGTVIASTTTESGGYYSVTNLNAGYYTAEVSGTGYNTTYFTVICIGGTLTDNQNASITPVLLPGEIRIILTWGETPPDIDSHLTGPLPDGTRFHMYYPYAEANWGSPWPEYVKLDRDDVDSYGPETTTIYQQIPGVYRFSVHDYTNRGSSYSTALSNSGAQVRVYRGSGLIATFDVPANREGTLWAVFEMDGDTITPINTMSYESDPGVVRQSSTPDAELMKNLPPKR